MKYYFAFILFLFGCSNKDPFEIPSPQAKTWLDLETKSDTIVTNAGNTYSGLYYAVKNWQQATDTLLSHGYRTISAGGGDIIRVQRTDRPLGEYYGPVYGPFRLHINEAGDTLTSQNFLDTIDSPDTLITSPSRVFILLH